jgi:hypothetical protein
MSTNRSLSSDVDVQFLIVACAIDDKLCRPQRSSGVTMRNQHSAGLDQLYVSVYCSLSLHYIGPYGVSSCDLFFQPT